MPRFARPHVVGGLHHVVSRFHNRKYLLDVENARTYYLKCLASAHDQFDTRILAYCLMSSHVHLVLQIGVNRLGQFMRAVGSPWVLWLNSQTGRLGTAMADRPKSVLCHMDTYALELVRYVHNNPVRANALIFRRGFE